MDALYTAIALYRSRQSIDTERIDAGRRYSVKERAEKVSVLYQELRLIKTV